MTRERDLDLGGDVVLLTEALVNVPSESYTEGPLADLVAAALRAYPHLEVTRIGDNVVARTRTGAAERVILAGHLDTVPANGNAAAVLVPPGGTVPAVGADGARTAPVETLYGLGSCDMKGGVAVALHCAATLPSPVRDVTYVFYAREEVASVDSGLGELLATHPELLADAAFAILLEPSDARVEAGCQGTLRARITARGRRAHSARAWMGDNAVHAAAEILNRLGSYHPAEVDIDGLTYREGLNAVGISGGVAGNVIPDECSVIVNYRFAPNRSIEQAKAHVAEVFDGFEVAWEDATPGALPGLSQPAVMQFCELTGSAPAPKFGWTDVARFAELGMPALNFGPGDPRFAHTAEEHVATADIRKVAQVLHTWLNGQ